MDILIYTIGVPLIILVILRVFWIDKDLHRKHRGHAKPVKEVTPKATPTLTLFGVVLRRKK